MIRQRFVYGMQLCLTIYVFVRIVLSLVHILALTQTQLKRFVLSFDMASITDYFKKSKKAETLPSNNEQIQSSSEKFYRMAFAEQKSKCKKKSCIEIISALESQIKEMEEKNQNTKDAIITCESVIAEKNCQIKELEKKLSSTNVTSDSVATLNRDTGCDSNEILIFHAFSNDFTSSQLANLREVSKEKRDDSKFISLALKSLYDKNLETLEMKSITGRSSKPGQKKEKMTPEKTAILGEIFHNRLQHATADLTERTNREKRLNKLIKDAQCNITKALKTQKAEKEVRRRLASLENID